MLAQRRSPNDADAWWLPREASSASGRRCAPHVGRLFKVFGGEDPRIPIWASRDAESQ